MLPIRYDCRYPLQNGESLNKGQDGGSKHKRRLMARPLLPILMNVNGGSHA